MTPNPPVKEPDSGEQIHGKKMPEMASGSNSVEIQEELQGNNGKGKNRELMKTKNQEQISPQSDSIIADQMEVIKDDNRITENMLQNTPPVLQPVPESTKPSGKSSTGNDSNPIKRWKRVNKTKALSFITSTSLASLKRSLDVSPNETIQTPKKLKGKGKSTVGNYGSSSQNLLVAEIQPHRSP